MVGFLFRWFAFIAAGFNTINLILALRRHTLAQHPAALLAMGRRIILVQIGGLVVLFLIIGVAQYLGGFPSVFFFLAPVSQSPYILPARLAFYAYWIACLWGLWQPGVVESALSLGYFRGAQPMDPPRARLLFTCILLVLMVGFAIAFLIMPPEVGRLAP